MTTTTADSPDRAERLRQAIRLKKAAATDFRAADLPSRPADQAARLGEMQHGLWLAHRLDSQSPAYNLASAFRVHGPLDVAKLERALNEVVSRHRLLRSTFRVERDTVVQVIHPHVPLTVEVLSVEDGTGKDNTGLAAAVHEAKKPFHLETGPLLRMRLIEETLGRQRLLLLVLHHILADEKSLALLWKELTATYHGRPARRETTVQFDDYIYWLRHGGGDDQGKRQQELDDWRRRLDPLPDDLILPFAETDLVQLDGETTASKAGGEAGNEAVAGIGRLLVRPLKPAVRAGIRRLAAATDVTPFMVFAFAFRLLLQRYTDGQRVAFATPVSTRSHPATARMIGYFTNPVVVSTRVDEEQPVRDAMRGFSAELREALAHASVSFQTLAEALSPPRRRGRHPIFQTMFVYQESGPPPEFEGTRLEPVTLDLGASKFDLTLFVTEAEGSLEIAIEYRADRFDEFWMRNLLGHYEALLKHLPQDLEHATAQVPMFEARELSQLQMYAQGAELETAGMALLPQQIFDQARRCPQSPAVTCDGVSLNYGELNHAAGSIARALTTRGVKPGDRVALFLDRSTLMIAAVLGSHWAGAAYVPLDPGYPPARNLAVLEDADVAAILTTGALRDHLSDGPWLLVDVDDLDSDPQNSGPKSSDPQSSGPANLLPESPAYILYTSGSTGRPKGVVVSHDNLRASNGARPAAYGAPPKRFLLLSSIAFDSSVVGIFWTLATAGTLVIPTDDEVNNPGQLARLVADKQITSLLCVPSLYAQMLQADEDLLQGLEIVIVAGESCSSRLVQEHFQILPQVRLFNEYGPTEATVWASFHEMIRSEVVDRAAPRPVAIGRPIPGVRVEILDRHRRPVPAGIPGHAWVAGPTVAQGYWRRPDLTAERFIKNRYRTGDLMSWTPDGRLLFLGREDEQIKLRGFRIELGEIETALLEFPAIKQAAVVARPLTSNSETIQLIAFIQPDAFPTPGSEFLASWRQDLATHLPAHMIPNRLVTLPELPRLPNGKMDRGRLQDQELDAEPGFSDLKTFDLKTSDLKTSNLKATISRIPNTTEQALISLWEGLLERPAVNLSDNFFELGGHSLLVAQMTLAIERDFETSLSAADVFANPTVETLARRIKQSGGPSATPYQHLFPIQTSGRKMPFIVAVPHFFSGMFAARFRGERPVYGLRGVSLRAEGNQGRWPTMKDLGEELADEVQRRFEGEACILAGYSFGASMAIETARVMEERGIPVHRLYLIAPMPADFYHFGPLRIKIDSLRKPVSELSVFEALRLYARSNSPVTRRPYARAWQWITVQSWRHILGLFGRLRSLAGLSLTPRILHADVRLERFRLHSRFQPGFIKTPTVIFNAQEPETDAAATWRPYFQGPFTVLQTPDPHLDEASIQAAKELILHHLRDMEDSELEGS